MHTLKRTLTDFIGAELATLTGLDQVNPNVITASKPEFGDYQANGVMGIAKKLGRNPRELGTELLARLNAAANPLVSHYELAGPGFINIHLAGDALRDRANELLVEPRLLVLQTESPQTIVVDYSSPILRKRCT